MKVQFFKTLTELANINPNIELLTGDLGFGVINPYLQKHKDRFLNCGIAEQNMVLIAAGMASEGKIPFVYSIGNFNTLRSLEMIRNDCAYHQLNVKIVSVGTGFSYGSLGMSHHIDEDVAVIRSIPNITIFSPSDDFEVSLCTQEMSKRDGTCYLRLSREDDLSFHNHHELVDIYKPIKIKEGKGIALLGTGSILKEAIDAHNISNNFAIYSLPVLKPIDENAILDIANRYDLIITLEEHQKYGGLGSIVAEVLSTNTHKARHIIMGIDDEFANVAGSQSFLRHHFKIDKDAILDIIKKN